MLFELLSVRCGASRFTSETIHNDLDTFIYLLQWWISVLLCVCNCSCICYIFIFLYFIYFFTFLLFFFLCSLLLFLLKYCTTGGVLWRSNAPNLVSDFEIWSRDVAMVLKTLRWSALLPESTSSLYFKHCAHTQHVELSFQNTRDSFYSVLCSYVTSGLPSGVVVRGQKFVPISTFPAKKIFP